MTIRKLDNTKDFNSYVYLIQSYIPELIRLLGFKGYEFNILAITLKLDSLELGDINKGFTPVQYLNSDDIINLYNFIDARLKAILVDGVEEMSRDLNLMMMRWLVGKGYQDKKDLEFFKSYISDYEFRKANEVEVRNKFYEIIKEEMNQLFMLEGGFTINERYREGFFKSELDENKK